MEVTIIINIVVMEIIILVVHILIAKVQPVPNLGGINLPHHLGTYHIVYYFFSINDSSVGQFPQSMTCHHHGWTMEIIQHFRHEIDKNNRIIMTFACVIMKLFTCGGKYCSMRALLRSALVLQYFPPHVNNFIITLAKS